MIRIILIGCNGRMGQMISGLAAEDENVKIAAGIDLADNRENSYPVYTDIFDCDVEADAAIDFSSANQLEDRLDYCVNHRLPIVLCSTGFSEEQLSLIRETGDKIPILRSANMSLGINTLMRLLREAAGILAPAGFDMEIVEKHHRMKVDAPSGTALALADCMNDALGQEYNYRFDRSTIREKRSDREIGISSVRGGSIVGEHEVIFAGTDEVIEIKHTAYSRAVFGKGAIEAAKFLVGKEPGMYDMSNVIG